jgi:hypothetical protein
MANIVIISGHYPSTTIYPKKTRQTVEQYCQIHGYDFYYEETEPTEKETNCLHFRRSLIIQTAYDLFPNAKWFLWLDSDVYVNRPELSIESQIDLTDENILYHTFHERPFLYPINTGVKFVNRKAIDYERELWSLRNTEPWCQFPFEQKTIYEYIFPRIPGQYIIHEPYVLNCLYEVHKEHIPNALFVHMCAKTEPDRNQVIQEFLETQSLLNKPIIGYIHVCQKPGWMRSFNMILNALKECGKDGDSLYDNTREIRVCVVNDDVNLALTNYGDENEQAYMRAIMDNPKFIVKRVGKCSDYERPTLLNMKHDADTEHAPVNYWYLHTKGLRWFGKPQEKNIINWIQLLLHWNVLNWKNANRYLTFENYDVYGCNYVDNPTEHFSGNFWWAKSEYIKTLKNAIGSGYNDPEFWLFNSAGVKPNVKDAFSNGFEEMGHYFNPYQLTLANMNKVVVIQQSNSKYFELYSTLLENRARSVKNILAFSDLDFVRGGGGYNDVMIKLFMDYFTNSTIHLVRKSTNNNIWREFINNQRVRLYSSTSQYNYALPLNDERFDIIIDNCYGVNNIDDKVQLLNKYVSMLSENGILLLENIRSFDFIPKLMECIPETLKPFASAYAIRATNDNENTNDANVSDASSSTIKIDSVVFIIDKNKTIVAQKIEQ